MATPLKQRIVGILVLLFLALIILPWVFGSRQQAVFENRLTSNKKVAPDRSLEDVKDEPDSFSNSTVEGQPQPATLPQAHEPSEIKENIPEPKINPGPINPKVAQEEDEDTPLETEKNSIEPAKLTQIQNKMMHTPVKTADSTNNTRKHKKKDAAVVALEAPEHTSASKPKKKLPSSTWTVQLGSFNDNQNAEKLVKQLKANGFAAYTKASKNSAGDEVTRVLVKQDQANKTAADTIIEIDKALNIHGVIVKGSS